MRSSSWLCLALLAAALLLLRLTPAAAEHQPLDGSPQLQEEEGGAAEAASSSSGPTGGRRMVDVWETDPELRIFKRLRDRDANDYGPLLDMFGLGDESGGELEELWSDPDVAHHILTNFPMFRAFGIGELADKAREDFTSEDGLQALAKFKAFARRAVERLGGVTDQNKLAETMQKYAELIDSDDSLREMAARVETGDKEAAFAIHNRIADDIWGDTLDLHEMGLEGQEPEATAKLRRLVRETEPALWRLVTQGDPLITKMMEDPTWIMHFAGGLENNAPV